MKLADAKLRIERRLVLNEATGCSEWTGSLDKDGYGWVSVEGKTRRLTRFWFELNRGPIPKGQMVLHHCDNPRCIALDHLFLGTNKDNVDDKVRKGRHAFGERNGRAGLTEDDIRQIRSDYARGERQVDLAKRFSVHQTHISLIVTRKEWAHVT